MQYDYLVKLLLIGDGGVGKSSLLTKFAHNTFSTSMQPTVGMDFKVKMLELGGRRVKLQVWDTAGQERFHTITQQYYRNAMGVILVYDVENEDSFNNIRRWAAQVAAHGAEDTNLMLLGNKADTDSSKRIVDTARGAALAAEYNMPFMETSAKSGVNVEEAFVALADSVRLRLQSRDSTSSSAPATNSFGLTPGQQAPRKGCCGGGGGN